MVTFFHPQSIFINPRTEINFNEEYLRKVLNLLAKDQFNIDSKLVKWFRTQGSGYDYTNTYEILIYIYNLFKINKSNFLTIVSSNKIRDQFRLTDTRYKYMSKIKVSGLVLAGLRYLNELGFVQIYKPEGTGYNSKQRYQLTIPTNFDLIDLPAMRSLNVALADRSNLGKEDFNLPLDKDNQRQIFNLAILPKADSRISRDPNLLKPLEDFNLPLEVKLESKEVNLPLGHIETESSIVSEKKWNLDNIKDWDQYVFYSEIQGYSDIEIVNDANDLEVFSK